MPIAFTCSCGKALKARDDWAGKSVKCPACGKPAKIPGGPASKSGARPAPARAGAAGSPNTKTAKKPAPAKPASDDIDLLPEGPPPPSPSDPAGSDEMFTEEQVQSLTATSKKCPHCGKQIFEGDPICINCGTDLKTGKKIVKKKERRPLGPFIKLGVLLVVVGAGGGVGLHLYKKSHQPSSNTGPAGVEDKTLPARQALRDGKIDDFKGFAKALGGLNDDQIMKVLGEEGVRGESTEEGRKKARMAAALLAWYGYYNDTTVNQMMISYLNQSQDEVLSQILLEGLYAAATPPPAKRYLQMPARFAGLEKELGGLKKNTVSSQEALNQVVSKSDGATSVPLQIEAIRLAVTLGQYSKLLNLGTLMQTAAEDVKPEVFKAIRDMTGRTFKDSQEFTQAWWWGEKANGESQMEWCAKRLDPAFPVEDVTAAVRMLIFKSPATVAPLGDKPSDEDVRAAAAKWKEWCGKNADKLK